MQEFVFFTVRGDCIRGLTSTSAPNWQSTIPDVLGSVLFTFGRLAAEILIWPDLFEIPQSGLIVHVQRVEADQWLTPDKTYK